MEDSDRIKRAKDLRKNQTKAESLLWELLRGKQLCGLKFRRQHPIGPFFADFACLSQKLIIELDGAYHDQTAETDIERQQYLERVGWKVIRFSNADVLDDVESVTRAIAAAVGLDYQLHRRPQNKSGMLAEKSPTRSRDSRPSHGEG